MRSHRWFPWLALVLFVVIDCSAHAAVTRLHRGQYRPVVCIDPGHPSEINSGKTVQNGLTEVDMNWRVAQELVQMLSSRGIDVVMTKHSREEFVSNRSRARIANEHRASLMIRLHCDTGGKSGFAVYFPDRQASKQGHTGPSKVVMARSRRAAECVQSGMAGILQGSLKNNGLFGESATAVGRRQGALTGSIFSDVPVVTVEMVFLSSKHDARFIGSRTGRTKIAEGLAAGILAWLQSNSAP